MWAECLFPNNFVWEKSFGNLNDMLKQIFAIEGLGIEMKERHFRQAFQEACFIILERKERKKNNGKCSYD